MKNLSPIQRLTALVLAAPLQRPFPEHEDLRPWCPLRRAAFAAGDRHNDLVQFAVELGFTYAEAHGIMRGYDIARAEQPCFEYIAKASPCEVAKGEQIGMQLARALGEAVA